MAENFLKSARAPIVLGALALSLLIAAPQSQYVYAQEHGPDNTARNHEQAPPTADQQRENRSDRDITQEIRKAIHDDKNLSTYGCNVKVVTDHGRVILRGPVRSEDEKNNVQAKAESIAGREHVDNQITVAERR
jgi:osmotically-inducible protein OsmY